MVRFILFRLKGANAGLLAICAGFFTQAAFAADFRVGGGSGEFSTIQSAITAAAQSDGADRILIKPGTYTENLVLESNIELVGDETARTIVRAASGSIMEIEGLENVTVRNLTFNGGGDTGIDIIDSTTGIKIRNNVFALGNAATAININNVNLSSDEVDIRHNTFHGNDTAIDRDSGSTVIKNNIFSSNNTAVTDEGFSPATISFNCFATGDTVIGTDPTPPGNPLFADISRLDFHLQNDSPCKDAGDQAGAGTADKFSVGAAGDHPDAGAYGGPDADTKPFPVQRPEATVDDSDTAGQFDVTLRWEENLSYLTNGYEIHYDNDSSGAYEGDDARDMSGALKPSPIKVDTVDTYTLFNLLSSPEAPDAPELLEVAPSNQSLDLRWSAVNGATGYRVEYGVASADEKSIDVGGDVTRHELSGLENGTTYKVRVSALKQTSYFFAIKVLGENGSEADVASAFSPERSVNVGSAQAGVPSNERTAIPEEIEAFPALPDQGGGCFIATAAYGHFSHPKVQLLRDFRDRFLQTNAPGRAFVRWYYRHSPAAAAFIARHETLRAAVRWALLPLIGIAWLMMHAQALSGIFAGALCVPAAALLRRKRRRTEQPGFGTLDS